MAHGVCRCLSFVSSLHHSSSFCALATRPEQHPGISPAETAGRVVLTHPWCCLEGTGSERVGTTVPSTTRLLFYLLAFENSSSISLSICFRAWGLFLGVL